MRFSLLLESKPDYVCYRVGMHDDNHKGYGLSVPADVLQCIIGRWNDNVCFGDISLLKDNLLRRILLRHSGVCFMLYTWIAPKWDAPCPQLKHIKVDVFCVCLKQIAGTQLALCGASDGGAAFKGVTLRGTPGQVYNISFSGSTSFRSLVLRSVVGWLMNISILFVLQEPFVFTSSSVFAWEDMMILSNGGIITYHQVRAGFRSQLDKS